MASKSRKTIIKGNEILELALKKLYIRSMATRVLPKKYEKYFDSNADVLAELEFDAKEQLPAYDYRSNKFHRISMILDAVKGQSMDDLTAHVIGDCLAKNDKEITVIEVGMGLDTRFERMTRLPSNLKQIRAGLNGIDSKWLEWIEMDSNDILAVRDATWTDLNFVHSCKLPYRGSAQGSTGERAFELEMHRSMNTLTSMKMDHLVSDEFGIPFSNLLANHSIHENGSVILVCEDLFSRLNGYDGQVLMKYLCSRMKEMSLNLNLDFHVICGEVVGFLSGLSETENGLENEYGLKMMEKRHVPTLASEYMPFWYNLFAYLAMKANSNVLWMKLL